jgi:hypothetical protein
MLSTMRPPSTHSRTHAERMRLPAPPKSAWPNCATKAVFVLDLFERDGSHEGQAHEQIDRGDDEDSAGEGDGQRPCGVAHLARDLARLPPSPEAEEGADGGAREWRQ